MGRLKRIPFMLRHSSAYFDWTRRRTEGARIFSSRPIWAGANTGESEGTARHGSPLLPFRGLMTVLQRAAGSAAKRQSKVREAGNQTRSDQL